MVYLQKITHKNRQLMVNDYNALFTIRLPNSQATQTDEMSTPHAAFIVRASGHINNIKNTITLTLFTHSIPKRRPTQKPLNG